MNSNSDKRNTVRRLKTSISKTLQNLETKPDGIENKNNISKIVKSLANDNKYKERIIIDITNFLKRYYKYFNDLDYQLNRIDKKFTYNDSKEIIDNVSKGINEVTDILTQNINSLKRHYEKIGLSEESDEMKNLRNFENGHAKLIQDLQYYKNVSSNISKEQPINSQKIDQSIQSSNQLISKEKKLNKSSWLPSFDFLFSPSKVNKSTKGGAISKQKLKQKPKPKKTKKKQKSKK